MAATKQLKSQDDVSEMFTHVLQKTYHTHFKTISVNKASFYENHCYNNIIRNFAEMEAKLINIMKNI